ncbi:hypothetical protein CRG98_010009 [Punica granatum]|uniref:Uncharacterized protein n=1 Tax=Punica granatum TaxID=22663 RepID=A0A2I0KP57_PUNGR|nr:hypothetical protein CRG98_010009 [Punica granatum]
MGPNVLILGTFSHEGKKAGWDRGLPPLAIQPRAGSPTYLDKAGDPNRGVGGQGRSPRPLQFRGCQLPGPPNLGVGAPTPATRTSIGVAGLVCAGR